MSNILYHIKTQVICPSTVANYDGSVCRAVLIHYFMLMISSAYHCDTHNNISLAWLGSAWFGSAWLGLAWSSLAWLGLTWLSLAWLGLAWSGLARSGLA